MLASPRIFTSFTNLFSKFPLGFHWKYPPPYHPYTPTINGYPPHSYIPPHPPISLPPNENKPIIVHHEEVPNPLFSNSSETDDNEPDLIHVPVPDLSIPTENEYPPSPFFFFDPHSDGDTNPTLDGNTDHIHIHHVGSHEPATKNTFKPFPNSFPRPIDSLNFGNSSTVQPATIYHPSQLKPVSTTTVFNPNFNVSINVVDERARLTKAQHQGMSATAYQKSPTTFRLPDALVTFNPEYVSKLDILEAFSRKQRNDLMVTSSSTSSQRQSLHNNIKNNNGVQNTKRKILRPLLVPTRNVANTNRRSEHVNLNNHSVDLHDLTSFFKINVKAIPEDQTESTSNKPFTRPKFHGSDAMHNYNSNLNSSNASEISENKFNSHDAHATTNSFFYPQIVSQANQEIPQLLKGLAMSSGFLPQHSNHQNMLNQSQLKHSSTTPRPHANPTTPNLLLYSYPTSTSSYVKLAPKTLLRFDPAAYSVLSNARFPISSELRASQTLYPRTPLNLHDSLLHYSSTLETLPNFERKSLLPDFTARLYPPNGTFKLHDDNGPDDSHIVKQTRADPCQYVNCQKLALICAVGVHRFPHRQKRQLPSFMNELPFTCGLYEVCCRVAATTPPSAPHTLPPATAPPAAHDPSTCGVSNTAFAAGRISTSGEGLSAISGEANFGEYPWQAAVLKKEGVDNVYVCAGTLVDRTHVLTAAHCISGYHASEIRVRLGEYNVNKDTEFYPHEETDVSAIFVHPEFYPGNLLNDIALIKIQQPIDFNSNPHIAPVCLPRGGDVFTGHRCWVTGWGKDGFVSSSRYQNTLKEVDVPVLDAGDCQDRLRTTRLGHSYLLHPGMLCAGGEPGKDACKGDGGGPLTCVDASGRHRLAGIVSWGIGCGTAGIPGVYVNVQHYLPWILRVAL